MQKSVVEPRANSGRSRSYDKAWFDSATPDFAKGLRGGIATLVPFYLAVRLERHEFAWMAIGGWLGTLVDPGGLRSTRAKTLSAFALVGGLALSVSERAAVEPWLGAFNLLVVAFAASLLRSLGAVWASAGTMIAVVVAIATAQGGAAPIRDGCFFAIGAAFAAFLSSVIWPIWTHLPLRRAEADVFDALARYATEIAACVRDETAEGDDRWVELARVHHRAIRSAVEEARRLALGGRSRRAGETRIGSNLRVLLGLAEAQLPLLITLKEASELEPGEAKGEAVRERLLTLAHRNSRTATTLRTPNLRSQRGSPTVPPPGHAPGPVSSIRALLDHLEDASGAANALSHSLDARAEAPSAGPTATRTLRDLLSSWRGDLSTLRDACSPRSTFFQHGLRVASTVFVTQLVARHISLHPHWITVTTLAVLQPYAGATATRAAQRVVGTVLGSMAAAAITLTVQSPVLLAALMFPLSVAAVATHRRNYRLFTFFLTPVFVLLAERFHGDWWTAVVRASDAAIGGALAFVAAVLVFPSRERTRLPELLASMLEAASRYAVAILHGARERHAGAVEASVEGARRNAGVSLGEAESALERLLAEPRHDSADEEYALQLITYARRVTSALTAIDTYAARDLLPEATLSPSVADAVERYLVNSLGRAAAFVRGRKSEPESALPELPTELEAHQRATLARLLRSAALVADVARGGLDRPTERADHSTQHEKNHHARH